jgi:hypothetical protein
LTLTQQLKVNQELAALVARETEKGSSEICAKKSLVVGGAVAVHAIRICLVSGATVSELSQEIRNFSEWDLPLRLGSKKFALKLLSVCPL